MGWLALLILATRRSGVYSLDLVTWYDWHLDFRELLVEGAPCEPPPDGAPPAPAGRPAFCTWQRSPPDNFDGWVELVEKVGGAVHDYSYD